MNQPTVDIAGVGVGPFNLGLSALLSRHADIKAVFLERRPEFHWHEGLLLPGTTLQVPFLADLVTMADPTHPLSYLNYLHHHDRLYQFCYYDTFMVPRREYDHYCRWAVEQLPACHFGEEVTDVEYDAGGARFLIRSQSVSGLTREYSSRDLVVGVGTVPKLPAWATVRTQAPILHAAQFAHHRQQLAQCKRVVVVGSGQSAAECVLSLLNELTPERVDAGASLVWITRAVGFHPMEFSKLGQECFTPAYMDYFHSIPRERRREIVAGQGLLYKGISFSTIADVFDQMYERSIGGRDPGLTLLSNCEVERMQSVSEQGPLRLGFRHRELDQYGELEAYAVVAATGYEHVWPAWLERFKGSLLEVDDHGDFIVDEHFCARRCDGGAGRIFVQNAEIFQHGVGSPDLCVAAIRNINIINQLLGRDHYRIPKQSSFQRYGMPLS
ncbi:putative histamine N-monooxygenase [Ectopseudomonas mendocina]|uniref:Histamine N-monooxygenase n=1 Tax=Ectopseudomonas mendocina TaxID=300 RepID=A0ABZ2RHU2_ECTME